MSFGTVVTQQTLTFDILTKAGRCKVDMSYSHIGKISHRSTHTNPHTHSLHHYGSYIQYICVCVSLYDLWLLGATGPERAQADDEEDDEQY